LRRPGGSRISTCLQNVDRGPATRTPPQVRGGGGSQVPMTMKLEDKRTIESRSWISIRTRFGACSIGVRNSDGDQRKRLAASSQGGCTRRARRPRVANAGDDVGDADDTGDGVIEGAVQRMAIPGPLAAAVPFSAHAWPWLRIALVGAATGGNGAVHAGAHVRGCG
jgi:hypothetical protein